MEIEAERQTAWEETGGIVPRPASAAPSTQLSEPSRCPAGDDEIAVLVTPALTLVAPVGMEEDDRVAWFAAAFMALEGFSGREIAAGVKFAMRKADHPSKIVPLIVIGIEAMGEYGRDTGRMARLGNAALPAPAAEEPPLRLAPYEVERMNGRFRRLGLTMRWRLNDAGEVEDAPADEEINQEAA